MVVVRLGELRGLPGGDEVEGDEGDRDGGPGDGEVPSRRRA